MPPQPSETSRFVDSVFKAWNAAQIDFLVLRNYEQLPEHTTNDIDCLIAKDQLGAAERELLRVASEHGFSLHNRAEFATLALYFSNDTNEQAHFDLFSALKWRSFDFLKTEGFLQARIPRGSFYIPVAGHEAAINLLATMIYNGRVKEKYKPSISHGFAAESQRAIDVLTRSYGPENAALIVESGRNQNWASIEKLAPSLRRTLIRSQLTGRMFATCASFGTDATRLVNRWLKPPGIFVVLCGPDGCGKSTIAEDIVSDLAGTFSPLKSRQYHWKIPVFSKQRLANRAPVSDPHSKPPRGRVMSLLFFAAQCIEFVIGSRILARAITFRGGLVLIDRYYYDFFIDPRRYRLRVPGWLVSLGYAFVKKPDLVFLLDAPAEVLQSRKKEVPLAETERQRRDYRALFERIPQARVIDAAKPARDVSREVERTILDWMTKRTRTRWPRTVIASKAANPAKRFDPALK
jgi:thymidylate kinase